MGNVVSFSEHKARKEQKTHVKKTQDNELTERIDRIKSSISKINQLMAELRGMADKPK